MSRMETKFCDASGFKLADADAGIVTGYGAIFGNKDLGGDIIVPGAFLKSINEIRASGYSLPMYFQHDRTMVAGMWTEMVEDGRGLVVTGRVNTEKQLGRDLLSDMKFGSVTGLSIGYRTIRDRYDEAQTARLLEECKLFEVSAVTTPMNPVARITGVKGEDIDAMLRRPETIREFERAIRDVFGFSASQAKAIASHGFKAMDRDPQDAGAAKAESDGQSPRDEGCDKAMEDLLASIKGVRGMIRR